MQHGTGAKLGLYQLVLLALGSVVGGSFFLSTAIPLRATGISVLLAFAIGGFLVYIVLMALSELTILKPAKGSFREYAGMAFGPMASFVTGWLYWAGLVLALSSEATAVALLVRLWAPALPIWLLSLAVIVLVTLLNLLDVGLFSMVESAMSGIKLVAVIAFLLVMAAAIVGLLAGRPPVGTATLQGQGLMPGGIGGVAGSMLIVLFTYAGFEVLGLAAPDAKDPGRTVPRAILLTVISLVGLYMLSMITLLMVLPRAVIEPEVSPFVAALRHVGLPWLAAVLNLVVISASISTMLAAMFGLSRMLHSLAADGFAPAVLKTLTPKGLPRNALFASAGAMLLGVVLAFILPKQVYLFLVSSGGFALIFAYLMILASQLILRTKLGCPKEGCQLPGYPYLTWVGIVLLLGALASMPLVPGQGMGLIAGLGLLLLFAAAYWLTNRMGTPDPKPLPDPTRERVRLR